MTWTAVATITVAVLVAAAVLVAMSSVLIAKRADARDLEAYDRLTRQQDIR